MSGEDLSNYLLARDDGPMSNPFAACSGSPPQCSTFSSNHPILDDSSHPFLDGIN